MRKTLTIITAKVSGEQWVHFTRVLQVGTGSAPAADYTVIAEGPCHDLWFPVVNGDLFHTVESILVIHRIAHNVTSIEPKPQPGDYLVTYNPANRS